MRRALALALILAAGLDARAQSRDLVAAGRELFLRETFGGNGRTCATCHPPLANFTLAPGDIAKRSDTDPLFVAEFDSRLAPRRHPETGLPQFFEVPPAMRRLALICENLDGFDRPCVLRSIPHTLALRTSITPVPGDVGPGTHALGWSGDGSPGDGSLRSFATGAVVQHFTRSLDRVPGVDFRLPTDSELDALEAFQLSLGRSEDVRLPLDFVDPIVAQGQVEFMRGDRPNTGAVDCENCHLDAGANGRDELANRMNDTDVEGARGRSLEIVLRAAGLDVNGSDPGLTFDDGNGEGRFNVPPVVEAADTPPFFHDSSCATLECAVGHYAAPEFRDRREGLSISARQVESIAAFLRALNALENLRSATDALERSLEARGPEGRDAIEFARSELRDAARVLREGHLHERVAEGLDALAEIHGQGRGVVRMALARIAELRGEVVR